MWSGRIKQIWQSFAFRLSLWFAGAFTVSAVILFALLYVFLTSFFEQSEREIIQARLKECAAVYEARGLLALNALVHRAEFDQNEGPFFCPRNRSRTERAVAGGSAGLAHGGRCSGRFKQNRPKRLVADSQGRPERIYHRQHSAE